MVDGNEAGMHHVIQKVHLLYKKILEVEPKDKGGVAIELSKKFVRESNDILRKKASMNEIEKWIENVVKSLQDNLNDEKPF